MAHQPREGRTLTLTLTLILTPTLTLTLTLTLAHQPRERMRIASRVTANCACCGHTSDASDSPAPPAVALDRSSARLSTKVRSHQRPVRHWP